MSKTCKICGIPIRTGRKYCWRHRNYSHYISGSDSMRSYGMPALGVGLFLLIIGSIPIYKNIEIIGPFLLSLLLWIFIITAVVQGIKLIHKKIKPKTESNTDYSDYNSKTNKSPSYGRLFLLACILYLLIMIGIWFYKYPKLAGPALLGVLIWFFIITAVFYSLRYAHKKIKRR